MFVCGKRKVSFSFLVDPTDPTLFIKKVVFFPKRNEDFYSCKTVHVNVYMRFIHNLPKLEMTQFCLSRDDKKDCGT